MKLYLDDNLILEHYWENGSDDNEWGIYNEVPWKVNYFSGAGVLKIVVFNGICHDDNDPLNNTNSMFDTTITQLAKYVGGELVPTLMEPQLVKLNECVPNISFGELMTVLKNWKNIDVAIHDNVFEINSVNEQLENAEIISLEKFEVPRPKISYTKGDTFLLQFKEVGSSDEYLWDKIFVDQGGMVIDSYNKDENTTEIIINGLPLPIADKKGVLTADHYVDDEQLVKLIIFDGSIASDNRAQDNQDLLLASVYYEDHRNWLYLRIVGKEKSWSFIIPEEEIRDLDVKKQAFAYGRHHVIKSINKDSIRDGIWNVEVQLKELY